jgi:hypothetical protein
MSCCCWCLRGPRQKNPYGDVGDLTERLVDDGACVRARTRVRSVCVSGGDMSFSLFMNTSIVHAVLQSLRRTTAISPSQSITPCVFSKAGSLGQRLSGQCHKDQCGMTLNPHTPHRVDDSHDTTHMIHPMQSHIVRSCALLLDCSDMLVDMFPFM